MKFSVVIPTFNRQETLRQCLIALQEQDYPDYEVIVIDDGSTDKTAEIIAQEFPQVRYFRQQNQGPAVARNYGIQEAIGEIIAFTDDDCLPPKDWLTRLADGYKRYPYVVGVGGILQATQETINSNIFARYEYYNTTQLYEAKDKEVVGGFECPAGGTANMSYLRQTLLDVNGFDENFPVAAGEDADIKLRICNKGYKLLYLPIVVIHKQEYNWPRFRHQCYVRGIGANYFEQKHGSGYPSRFKTILRVIKRLITFPLDLITFSDKSLGFIKLIEGLYTCLGQWDAVSKLNKPKKDMTMIIPPEYIPMMQNIMELESSTLIAKLAQGCPKILNVGPSWGRDYYNLTQAGHNVINIDIAHQQHLPNLTTANLAHGTPFADKTFDAVIIAEVLEHIWNDTEAVREARRILKDNGKLIITVPFYNDDADFNVRLHSPKITQRLLCANGFTPIDYIERGGLVSFPRFVHGIRKILQVVGLGQAWNEWVIALDEQLGRHPTPFLRLSPGHGGFFVSIKGQSVDFEGLNVEAFRH